MEYYDRTPDVLEKAEIIRDKGVFSFLFVGRIARDKGIEELVSAFVQLYQETPNIRLLLVGPLEDDLDPISMETRSIISTYKAIHTIGRQTGTDLLAYYAASDCFVLPSYREGFPNTVLEAGAMGLPCIVTDINGSREIITDGYNGLIVPPRDVNRLYCAMKRMISDTEMRNKMAKVCRSNIEQHYEQGYVRKCLYDFYRSIC